MDSDKIGGFLQDLRREQNLTQEELGEKLGTTNKTISRWETGRYLPPVDMLVSMSKLFNVSVNEILSGERLQTADYQPKAEENIVTTLKKSQVNKRGKDIAIICCSFALGLLLLMIAGYLIIQYFFLDRSSAQFANGVYEYTGEPFDLDDETVIEQIELTFKQIDEQTFKNADNINVVQNYANKRAYSLGLLIKTEGDNFARFYLKYYGSPHSDIYDFEVFEQADCSERVGYLRLMLNSYGCTDEYDVVRNIDAVFTLDDYNNLQDVRIEAYLQQRSNAPSNRE